MVTLAKTEKHSINSKENVAERIKASRSIAGYASRKEFCFKFGISYDTLDAWERGKNPLTLKGAKRIVEALKSVGVYCSEEWLMEGKGFSPRPMNELTSEIKASSSDSLSDLEKNLKLSTEVATFTTLNENSIVTLITDDSMLPFYKEGDYVGGIRLKGLEIEKAIDKKCIIELQGENTVVRQLQNEKSISRYTLGVFNKNAVEQKKIVARKNIVSAAPIIWHRSFFIE
jgi:transcriptional regulator with XRE-family HTH domain